MIKLNPGPSLKRLMDVLSYNLSDGTFRWRALMGKGRIPIGAVAGTIDINGYRIIRIDGERFRASRLAWFYVTGTWPKVFIDHIDGDVKNNSFKNLRLATNAQNQHNSRAKCTSKTGLKGAYKHHSGKWFSQIVIRKKRKWLGTFDSPLAAHNAYVDASRIAFGRFARSA